MIHPSYDDDTDTRQTTSRPNIERLGYRKNNSYHSYNTRSSSNFHLNKIRLNITKKSIFCKGPQLWNNIPQDIISSPSINVFKKEI